ncbi:hypothetical protein BC829DRAFT_385311 [Chytridium lagenaria]|nr:hypothetical protein BC829DRAFT_385311 [Chytridium lagenaria]
MDGDSLRTLVKHRDSSPEPSYPETASVVSGLSAASLRRRQQEEDEFSQVSSFQQDRPVTAASVPSVLEEFYKMKKAKMDEDNGTEAEQSTEMRAKSMLAVSFRKGKLGAAHFSPEDGTLYLLEDIEDRSDRFELARLLIFQINPNLVLCHPRVDESFLGAIRECVSALPSANNTKKTVEVRPSTEFLYKPSLNRILGLGILDFEKESNKSTMQPSSVDLRAEQKNLSAQCLVESIVSLENCEMVSSVINTHFDLLGWMRGIYFSYISRTRVLRELEGNSEEYMIRAIEQYSLAMHMRVNQTTLAALQIFQDEAHPNLFSSRKKEGLSLFAPCLKIWFLRPSMDTRVINNRLDMITFFINPANLGLVTELRVCLGNIKNIPRILHFMKTRTALIEWQAMLKFSFYALKIQTLIEAWMFIIQEFTPEGLREVGSLINNIVNL